MNISITDINEKRLYKFNQFRPNSSRIIGSHRHGWVILSDQIWGSSLFHMFLEIRIQLPNNTLVLDTKGKSTQVVIKDNMSKAILYANDPHCREDFLVVTSFDYQSDTKLAFWRYGDSNWSSFGGGFFVSDITFCNTTLYAIRGKSQYDHMRYLQVWGWKTNLHLPQLNFSFCLDY